MGWGLTGTFHLTKMVTNSKTNKPLKKSSKFSPLPEKRAVDGEITVGSRKWNGLLRANRTGISRGAGAGISVNKDRV